MVTKNGYSFEFYSSDKLIIEHWKKALRSVCVLNDFHEEYKAIKMIGEGGFAKVYLVEWKQSKERYAVKAFSKESLTTANKSNAKTVLLNEIDILKSLDHDNIIKLYEVHETENSIYLVMELIQGNSLQDILKRPSIRKEYSSTQLKNMLCSILDALAYISSKGIMHRDLKPANILVEKGGKIKIVDFGLATYINLSDYIFNKCGTPGYIAPEVFKSNSEVSKISYDDRCDVFSAGCIFYYMLFGHPLFDGCDASDTLQLNKKFTGDFEEDHIPIKKAEKDKITKESFDFLSQLLEFDKGKRISAIEALYHPYFRLDSNGSFKASSSHELNIISTKTIKTDDSSFINSTNTDSLKDEQSPLKPGKKRFTGKDSLYLDVGRPEMNGKLDTLTTESVKNSVSLKGSCNTSLSASTSTFAKRESSLEPKEAKERSGTFKNHHTTDKNQSVLKAAIFRNIQQKNNKNHNEEAKENELPRRKVKRKASGSAGTCDSYEFSDDAPNPFKFEHQKGNDERDQKKIHSDTIKHAREGKNPKKAL
jgi:serine/threonine protein kinase